MPLADLIPILGAALLIGSLSYWWVMRPDVEAANPIGPEQDDTALLFESGVLAHGSEAGLARFGLSPGFDEWEDFQAAIADTFPDFPNRPDPHSQGAVALSSLINGSPINARVSWRGDLARVVLGKGKSSDDRSMSIETGLELAALQRMNECLPDPVWQIDDNGQVIWHNPVYEKLYKTTHGTDPERDSPLFGSILSDMEPETSKRISLLRKHEEKSDWFSVTFNEANGARVFHARIINEVVEAEEAQRNFVQTLAKTFAHLSIGLAIFDRNQQLALFNPALIDLTGLQAEFLSGRPNILTFFDLLRENRRMPEPKNYQNWRQEISELIAAANDGRYQETWSLESGQTYRVTGRPHPDGATAFLIEDISAEVTLTRNFRAELELGQSLLDTLEEGLAVFSPSGIQTFSNLAYRNLWGLNPEASFVDVTIYDAIQAWRSQTKSSGRWKDMEEFVLEYGDRHAWNMKLSLKDGRPLVCHLMPIASGATLIRFRVSSTARKSSTQSAT